MLTLEEVLVMLVVILLLFFISFVIFILLLFFISFPGYFTMPLALNPGFSGPWRPPPALTSTLTTFDCLFFFIYPVHYSFEWAFFTHRRFLPYAPFQYFWHNLYLSRPPWELAVLPWGLQDFILILETQTRPICLFDSQNPQSFIHFKFVFIHVNITKALLVVKTLIKKIFFSGSVLENKTVKQISNHTNQSATMKT